MEPRTSVELSPFWAAVRRRHPDVDLVLVPDEAPAPDGAPVTADALSAAAARVAAYATGAWALATGVEELFEPTIGFGPAEHTVVARVRASARAAGSPLAALEAALLDAGWRTTRPTAAVELLVAQRSGVELRASYAATGVLTMAVESVPYAVGVARARELTRA
jgi:hypothetical protein